MGRAEKIEHLNSDISGLRHRLLMAKRDLTEVHNDKAELMANLNEKERSTYRYKTSLRYGSLVKGTGNKEDEQNVSSLKQDVNLQQTLNGKL